LKYAENILVTWNRARQEIAVHEEDQVAMSVAGVSSLWDIVLQGWLHQVHREHPQLVLNAEVSGVDAMLRQLNEGALDLGFMFESPQLDSLEVREVMQVRLIMVASQKNLTSQQALQQNYILVDWGTSFAVAHAHSFPDMPTPVLRAGLGRMALAYLAEFGGAAYMAEPMVTEALKKKKLYRVTDAPVIERNAYAVYAVASERRELLDKILDVFTGHAIREAAS
jgi:DNA-binding transcriptional LysR family regulator